MLFTTYQFALFVFVLFVIYYLVNKKYQWIILLIGSYLFYAYAGVSYLFYFLTTTLSTYLISQRIKVVKQRQKEYMSQHKEELTKQEKRQYKEAMKAKQWHYLLLCLLFNFGVLAVVKYTDFMIGNINGIIGLFNGQPLSFMNFALPMGISFYTFQTMSYIIDVYRGTCQVEDNVFKLGLFVSFFPQVIQGPISRFNDLSQTLYQEHDFDLRQIHFGFQRVLWGYFKKLVIADRILVAVNTLIGDPSTYDGIFVLVGMVFYAIELYADFTGGIDITIGVAQMFGVHLTENFERPYFSKDIAEYWRRWHITMGTWFKDYIFYPLSIHKSMLHFSIWCRKHMPGGLGKRVPVYVSSFIVWFATGIWHGASWNFIVWGLLNCLVICVSEEFKPFYKWFHEHFHVSGKLYFRLFQVMRTFLLMSSLRILDCYRNVPLSFSMFGSMFTDFHISELTGDALLQLGLSHIDYMILIVGVIILITFSLIQRKGSVREKLNQKPIVSFVVDYVLIFVIVLFGAYSIGYDASQFIYNQF